MQFVTGRTVFHEAGATKVPTLQAWAHAAVAEAIVRTESAIDTALSIASHLIESGTPYKFGAKGDDGLDCSGFVARCYRGMLPDGAANQHHALGNWLYSPDRVRVAKPGDLAFYVVNDFQIGHVAIIQKLQASLATILHSSEGHGGATREDVKLLTLANDGWTSKLTCVGSVRPYLVRRMLNTAIGERV